ncbi:ATP synthase subunit I [Bryobacter aggregatus]|uniref:ATP synthase subunit I n=1 Tax=Bryobacter aggregatus TaxID=360054 RepID=UPI0004E21195|nr:ATP synthase subunit I [Bryobacter aggregatus]
MIEYRSKSNRILRCALILMAIGTAVFLIWRGQQSGLAFVASATVSLASLYMLARGIDILSSGRKTWLKGFGFVIRFAVYAVALSAILKVYPKQPLEVFFGIFLSVLAIGFEALIESYKNART